MLNNRKLEIKLIKDAPQHQQLPAGTPSTQELTDISATVSDITDTVVSGAVTLMGSYMVADTIRKIVIHTFTR